MVEETFIRSWELMFGNKQDKALRDLQDVLIVYTEEEVRTIWEALGYAPKLLNMFLDECEFEMAYISGLIKRRK